jgi:hypothetical protein
MLEGMKYYWHVWLTAPFFILGVMVFVAFIHEKIGDWRWERQRRRDIANTPSSIYQTQVYPIDRMRNLKAKISAVVDHKPPNFTSWKSSQRANDCAKRLVQILTLVKKEGLVIGGLNASAIKHTANGATDNIMTFYMAIQRQPTPSDNSFQPIPLFAIQYEYRGTGNFYYDKKLFFRKLKETLESNITEQELKVLFSTTTSKSVSNELNLVKKTV